MRAEILEIRAQFPADLLGEYYRRLVTEIGDGGDSLSWGADDSGTAENLRQAILANRFDYGIKDLPPETLGQINKIFAQLLGHKFETSHFEQRQLRESLFYISAKEKVTGELCGIFGGKTENKFTRRKAGVYIYFGPISNRPLEKKILAPVLLNLANFVINEGWDDLDKCREVFPDRQPTVGLFLDYFSSNELNQIVFQAVSQGVGAYFEAGQLFFDEDKKPLVLYPTAYTLDLGLYWFHYAKPLENLRGLMLLSPEYQGYYLAGFSPGRQQPPYYLFDRYRKRG